MSIIHLYSFKTGRLIIFRLLAGFLKQHKEFSLAKSWTNRNETVNGLKYVKLARCVTVAKTILE